MRRSCSPRFSKIPRPGDCLLVERVILAALAVLGACQITRPTRRSEAARSTTLRIPLAEGFAERRLPGRPIRRRAIPTAQWQRRVPRKLRQSPTRICESVLFREVLRRACERETERGWQGWAANPSASRASQTKIRSVGDVLLRRIRILRDVRRANARLRA